MNKKIISVLALVMMLFVSISVCFAAPDAQTDSSAATDTTQEAPVPEADPIQVIPEEEVKEEKECALFIKSSNVDYKEGKLTIVVANKSYEIVSGQLTFVFEDSANLFVANGQQIPEMSDLIELKAGSEKELVYDVQVAKNGDKNPVLNANLLYNEDELTANLIGYSKSELNEETFNDILNTATSSKKDAIINFLKQTGFSMTGWKSVVMILIACLLFYLAIVKQFEPLLLLPIAFGMLLTNLMGSEVFHEQLFAGGHVHWDLFGASNAIAPGLIDILYLGVKLGIYPCLIFVGVGAMTDFGPLIANPKSLLLGAAAQVGIFATYIGAYYLGFTPAEAGSIGIIGGADGPTAIFVTSKLAPHLLGPIAVAAYSYMALVPVIQPPIMRLLTTKSERQIVMKELRPVSQKEKIIFPVVVTIFVSLLVPSAAPLVGCLMLGNLLKESGVCERLSKTVQNELMNIVTVFLGVSVGATATAETFLSLQTIKIIVMGVVAFGVATACGVLLAKFMNLFLKNKINPLIGSAGVSAVPMAARVSQKVGQEENPGNFLLMHAMGPNVAGVIGSAIAAGALIAMLAK